MENIPKSQSNVKPFDLNEIPNEETSEDLDEENLVVIEEIDGNYENIQETQFMPFVGQIFLSEEEAFSFYQRYANHHGFSIRKGRFVTKNGVIVRRDLFCHREGRVPLKVINPLKEQRKRESLKCECKAHIRIKLLKCHDEFPFEWQVVKFVVDHNHELLTPQEVRFLPANRIISKDDREHILLLKEGGLSIRQIIRVLELEKNVKHGYLPFLEKDISNLYGKVKIAASESDAMGLLKQCEEAKKDSSKFQYAYTVDGEGKLEHIFWSTSSCFDWYRRYGDVVVFDTTYKVNGYDMPFGIFVGINNHGKTIIFGCALLRNETTAAFCWLMKTFVSLMGKPPKTILTDQDPWMTEAISKELPSTKHAFCIWHITSKFSGWFNALLREKYSKWCSDFYDLYKLENVEEFEYKWPMVMAKYNLQSNKHVKGMYQVKTYWVLAYLRDHFFGGMTTTGRSESINAFVKRFINSSTSLSTFFKQVDLAVEDLRQKEEHDKMLMKCRGFSLRTMSPLEQQAHGVLTQFAFKKFQEEYERATQYSIMQQNGNIFVLEHFKATNSKKHIVNWDGEKATCNCKNFEFWGILCRHILSIFLHKDCYEIPNQYLPSRWSHQASYERDEVEFQENGEQGITFHCDSVISPHSFVDCPPISKTKGRPKRKRCKGGNELAKRLNTCGLCNGLGHNIATCSQKENVNSSVNTQKRKKKKAEEIGLNPILYLKD